jgi:hypothetical protein
MFINLIRMMSIVALLDGENQMITLESIPILKPSKTSLNY